jgi:hypothetical protein
MTNKSKLMLIGTVTALLVSGVVDQPLCCATYQHFGGERDLLR